MNGVDIMTVVMLLLALGAGAVLGFLAGVFTAAGMNEQEEQKNGKQEGADE